jgi:hypothetical protein
VTLNGANAGADRTGERVAVGDGSHASDALICAAMHASTTRRINREIGARPSAISTYGCTKSRVGASDAGSIPATSTTTGVQGFDGALIRDGQPAMVPAASGSPLSRGPARWAKTKLPTTTAITSRCFALRDAPAGRGVTKAGTFFNAADARSRATHLRAGWSPIVETHPCASRCSGVGPEMPARRISARPAELFNASDRIAEENRRFTEGLPF